MFYRDVWLPGRGYNRKCLDVRDRGEAERLGRELLAKLSSQATAAPISRRLTLGELWRRYQQGRQAFHSNSVRVRAEAAGKARALLAHFGADCDVRDLTADDQTAYVTARRAGGIRLGPGEEDVTQRVRARVVEADLALLHRMLRWATTVRVDGERLLDVNPLMGVRKVREANPRRPVATWERFEATRRAMQQLASEATTDAGRQRWIRAEFALVLAEATGRRAGSIRQPRWEDCDPERHEILWRTEADKRGCEWRVPMPTRLVDDVRRFQHALAAVGGWVFPSEQNPAQPMDRHAFRAWLEQAEAKAGLPKLSGGLWHPYRRKWATERKGLPLPDVAAAGGWKDVTTLMTCYQHATTDALFAVMNDERKVHDAAVVARNA